MRTMLIIILLVTIQNMARANSTEMSESQAIKQALTEVSAETLKDYNECLEFEDQSEVNCVSEHLGDIWN
jgi:hypothetical protein